MINLNDRKSDFPAKVHKLALELEIPRTTDKEKEEFASLPRLKYLQSFRRRCLTGGPLSFLEAKSLVREQLTFDKWKIRFYEVIQFPQVRFFESEKEARNYWRKIKMRKTLHAQEATLSKPAEHIFADRAVEEVYRVENFKPDPMVFKY